MLYRRYVKFAVQYEHQGWNNVLQDIIMTSQISVLAGRANAFQPYVWWASSLNKALPVVGWPPKSAKIPLSAFIAGPMAGGGEGMRPRFVSDEWWEVVCPSERRTRLDVGVVQRELELEWGRDPEGYDMLERWGRKLREMNDTCVEVGGDHVFSFL